MLDMVMLWLLLPFFFFFPQVGLPSIYCYVSRSPCLIIDARFTICAITIYMHLLFLGCEKMMISLLRISYLWFIAGFLGYLGSRRVWMQITTAMITMTYDNWDAVPWKSIYGVDWEKLWLMTEVFPVYGIFLTRVSDCGEGSSLGCFIGIWVFMSALPWNCEQCCSCFILLRLKSREWSVVIDFWAFVWWFGGCCFNVRDDWLHHCKL